uniref:cyclin-dependent kinase n=1 Tax=Clastoptera arizonana TaxID=38151 RepID=A0A1B6CUL1_9HEMI
MDKYESISLVGEGSYGVVLKCRHKASGQIVAIKKFIETEEDHNVRKMALREIRMLKKLQHPNLVNMIEVFRRKRRFYLVFEYMDHTLLDELEDNQSGLGNQKTRCHMFQVIRGIDFCHTNNILHRDIKPENVLVSENGVIKLCDFGFARFITNGPESYTDYVATRWYRAPELLVGDTKYGREVDIWAIGCLFAELMSGDPIFPGESDIDQLFKIIKLQGRLCLKHEHMIARNPMLKGIKKTTFEESDGLVDGTSRSLYKLYPKWPHLCLEIVSLCLRLDPSKRPASYDLLHHSYFTHDNFVEEFLPEISQKIEEEFLKNPLLVKQFVNSDLSLEKKGLTFSRRNSQLETRWRMNFASENHNCRDQQKNLFRESDTLEILEKRNNTNYLSLLDVNEEGCNLEINNGNLVPANKHSPLFSGHKVTSFPCKTSSSYEPYSNSLSPLPYQSLQVHNTVDHLSLPSPPGLLHPAINNLSFSHSTSGENINKHRNIVPQRGGGLSRTQPGKKLDLHLPVEMYSEGFSKPPWKLKCSHDDFSLPNLPGTSPKGVKKKFNHLNTNDNFISPNESSSLLLSSPNNLPFV